MKNKPLQCCTAGSVLDLGCSDIALPNSITEVRIDMKGNCYDQDGNYLGRVELINGIIEIKQLEKKFSVIRKNITIIEHEW